MNTIIYSAVGIILLVGISFLVNQLGDLRNNKMSDRLTAFRKKIAANKHLLSTDKEYDANPFTRNGYTTVSHKTPFGF